MRILIIGGTRFVGHGMAEAALDAGHDVSLLHRHETTELPGATHLLADRDGDLSVLDGLSFDATIDVCAYVPGRYAGCTTRSKTAAAITCSSLLCPSTRSRRALVPMRTPRSSRPLPRTPRRSPTRPTAR